MFSWMGLLEASAAGGICIMLFFLVSQICGGRYTAKYKKVIWLLIAIRLCIPINSSLLPQPFTVRMPVYVLGERGSGQAAGNVNNSLADMSEAGSEDFVNGTIAGDGVNNSGPMAGTSPDSRYFTSWDIAIILWSCGSIAVLLYYLLGHIFFYHKMMQRSEDCSDKNILAATIKMSK